VSHRQLFQVQCSRSARSVVRLFRVPAVLLTDAFQGGIPLQCLVGFANCAFPHRAPRAMTRLSEYLKVTEAARFLGVSQNTLRAWAKTGKIPMRRNPANGYRLFKRRDLEKYLAKLEDARGSYAGRAKQPRPKPS